LTLVQILLIGINTNDDSSPFIFPDSLLGVDPWTYRSFNTQLITSGNLIEGWSYQLLPVFDLVIGTTRMVTELSYKWASIISVGLIQVALCTSFTYLLGKKLIDPKTGLFSALFLILANHFINFAWAPIATRHSGNNVNINCLFIIFQIRTL
jgi:hypothetical protein